MAANWLQAWETAIWLRLMWKFLDAEPDEEVNTPDVFVGNNACTMADLRQKNGIL